MNRTKRRKAATATRRAFKRRCKGTFAKLLKAGKPARMSIIKRVAVMPRDPMLGELDRWIDETNRELNLLRYQAKRRRLLSAPAREEAKG